MSFIDDFERHEIYLARLATQLLNAHIYPSLAEAYKAARLILLDAEKINSPAQLNKITAAIRKATNETIAKSWEDATAELEQIAIYEAGYYAALVGGYQDARLKTPADKQVADYVKKSLMTLHSGKQVDSGFWGEFVSAQTNEISDFYDSAVKAGFSQGETVAQVAARKSTVSEGIGKTHSEGLARTGLSHYATQARQAMAQANADVIEREIPIVTFDNRTSIVCAGIASKYPKGWKAGESPIGYPPYHHGGCRTAIAHLVKGQEYIDGTRAAIGGQKGAEAAEQFEKKQNRTDKRFRYRGKKDLDVFKSGQISTKVDIDKWMRSQPDWFIKSNLGETRYKLFKDGGVPLKGFTDATNRPLTIDELRQLDSEAFKRAGL